MRHRQGAAEAHIVHIAAISAFSFKFFFQSNTSEWRDTICKLFRPKKMQLETYFSELVANLRLVRELESKCDDLSDPGTRCQI